MNCEKQSLKKSRYTDVELTALGNAKQSLIISINL
jgi:hypothetical protein